MNSSWLKCPKAFRKKLLPEEAVEHDGKTLGRDNRMRLFLDPTSDQGLMYPCKQAQMLEGPAGMQPCF